MLFTGDVDCFASVSAFHPCSAMLLKLRISGHFAALHMITCTCVCVCVCGFFFFFFFVFFSPILSRRRLNVYHTSTHDVALLRIYNAGLKCATYGSLKIQDAKFLLKIRHLHTIAQLYRAISSQLRHVSMTGKKLVKQQYLLHMLSQYG